MGVRCRRYVRWRQHATVHMVKLSNLTSLLDAMRVATQAGLVCQIVTTADPADEELIATVSTADPRSDAVLIAPGTTRTGMLPLRRQESGPDQWDNVFHLPRLTPRVMLRLHGDSAFEDVHVISGAAALILTHGWPTDGELVTTPVPALVDGKMVAAAIMRLSLSPAAVS